MTTPFSWRIEVDDRLVPDWTPYLQPVAPSGSPNAYIVLDAWVLGDGALGQASRRRTSTGSPPRASRTNWHDGAVLADPLSLLTGRNHDQRHGVHR